MSRLTSGGGYLYTDSLSTGFQNTPFSYSGWVRLNNTSDQVVFCFSDMVTNANLYLAIFILSGNWFISRRDATNGVQGTAGTATPSTGVWYHVCLTANSVAEEKLYIDGSLEVTNSHVSMLENFNGFSLGIGRRTAGTFNGGNSNHAFGGLYTSSLGTADINALSGGAHPLVANPSAWDIHDLTGASSGNEVGRFGNVLTESGTVGSAESPLVFIGSPLFVSRDVGGVGGGPTYFTHRPMLLTGVGA